MKISVAILSRAHPEALTGVVMGLQRLSTERHDIRYIIGTDNDDEPTHAAIMRLIKAGLSVEGQYGARPVSRGEVENKLLACSRTADAVTLMTDRTFCITPGWDDVIARAVTEKPNRALWWSCPSDNVCAIPIISRPYLEACDYHWSPEIFPFWFDDTWNQHIDLLIHGLPSMKVKTSFSGQRGKTTRGRDFGFWLTVFIATLPMRVQVAKEMAAKFNVPFVARPDVMQYLDSYAKTMMAGVGGLEQTYGDHSDPGPEYFVAKERAERMLVEMRAIQAEAAE